MGLIPFLLGKLVNWLAPVPDFSNQISADLLAEAEEDEECWEPMGEYPEVPPWTAH